MCIRDRDYKAAEAEYQAYVKRFPDSAGVWQAKLNIGTIRLSAGKPAAARKMFQAITDKYKIDVGNVPWYAIRAFYYEASAFEAEGNTAEAIARYKQLVEHRGRTSYGRRARERLEALAKPADSPARR